VQVEDYSDEQMIAMAGEKSPSHRAGIAIIARRKLDRLRSSRTVETSATLAGVSLEADSSPSGDDADWLAKAA